MKKVFSVLAVLLFAALLLTHPDTMANGVREGISLCTQTVVPSLFPFFVVTSLLLSLGVDSDLQGLCGPMMQPLFQMRGVCALPLLAGLLGGYPTGARTAAQLHGRGVITRQEAELLLGFCNNCGPGFLIGYVGVGILGSMRAGVCLFLIHTVAALLTGVLLCRMYRRREVPLLSRDLPAQTVSVSGAVTTSVASALNATLNICAYVVLFRAAAALISGVVPDVLLGGLEMVSGTAAVSSDVSGFVTAAGIVAWGGLSVHCQTLSVAENLSLRFHMLGKILQTILSIILAFGAAQMLY
ncbi:MAG: sporulation protein [Oscillospiraceae bacterium]|nr:sporulation protein [Oscillospiraceae bacterium]